MSGTTPICPACRFIREMLALTPGRITFVPADVQVPPHLDNCPAREARDCGGIKVMTHIQLPEES